MRGRLGSVVIAGVVGLLLASCAAGPGAVPSGSISLRGSTYPFHCTSKLSTHLVKSTGAPDETFSLDVTATHGVRWAVTLARASLDGS